MTGYDVFKRALNLLGYNEAGQIETEREILTSRSLELINQLAEDLRFTPPQALTEKISADSVKLEALSYGLAMLLSLTLGDSNKNSIYTDIYNSKRAAALKNITAIEDTLPIAFGG